jgi:RES domain-containing protein
MKHVERGGLHFRVCDPSWSDPLDTSFSRRNGGRWNAPGAFGVLYLNATVSVAAGNARRAYEGEIATLFDLLPEQRPDLQLVTVNRNSVVDAVTNAGLKSLRLPASYPVGVTWSACQRIGSRAHAAGENGIACRTADAMKRTDEIVEGEELVVFDTASHAVSRAERIPFSQWYPVEVETRPAWAERRTEADD